MPEVDLNWLSPDNEVSVLRKELELGEPETIPVEVGGPLQVPARKLGDCRVQDRL
jgi:hypothetical protein